MCIHIYLYTCRYIYIYIHICIYIYTYTSLCVYIHIYTCLHIYIYIYICIERERERDTSMCIYIYIYTYTYVYIYIYICTYIHTHANIYINYYPKRRRSSPAIGAAAAKLQTNNLHFRGLDSGRILNLRSGILMSKGDFPGCLSQRILVGMIREIGHTAKLKTNDSEVRSSSQTCCSSVDWISLARRVVS